MKIFNARFGAWALLMSLLGSPFAPALSAQTFTDVTAAVVSGLPQLHKPCAAWGDYDNDGRLDFLFTASGTFQIWRNMGSAFTNVTASVAPGLLPVGADSVAWGDYDHDGWLDFIFSGNSGSDRGSEIWRNVGGIFTNVTATVAPGLPALYWSSVVWGDYDNDGRLDFLLTGSPGWTLIDWVRLSQIWRNTGTGFTNVTAAVAPGLPAVMSASMAWADYDNDGRLDFLFTGNTRYEAVPNSDTDFIIENVSQLWRNTGNGFINVTPSAAPALAGVYNSSVAWSDYDNDGRQDFLLTGSQFSQLWRNTGNGFANVTATVAPGLSAVAGSSVAWADYDNDGRSDFLIAGSNNRRLSQLWRNTEGGFTNVTATVAPGLPLVNEGWVAWGDYDNDGRRDFLLAGAVGSYCDGCDEPPRIAQLWRNTTVQTSPPPVVVTGLPTDPTQTSITLNMRSNPRGQTAHAWFVWGDSTNYGNATVVQPIGNGNSFTDFSQTITGLSTGVTYYYRAVGSNDQGLVFLGFEQRFVLALPGVTPSPVGSFNPNSAIINAHVTPNNLPTYGWFEWGLSPAYGQVTPVQSLGNSFDTTLSQSLSGLEVSSTYYFRAVVSNGLGVVYGEAQSFVEPDIPVVCPGSISPTIRIHGNGGGSGYSVNVHIACNWVVINSNSWITITSPTNGSGTGTVTYVTYALTPNTNSLSRSGNINIGGHNLLVTQAGGAHSEGCYVSITPGSTDRGYGAMMGTVSVGAATNCAWEVVNTTSWMTILSSTNGIGNGEVVYAIEANPDVQPRSGSFTIGGRIFTVRQAGHSTVSLPADQVVALGGTATFSVTVNLTPPFTYQWQFDGGNLVNGNGISGATTSNLVLTGVQYGQEGHYRCVVTRSSQTFISSSATLTVAPISNAVPLAEAVDTGDMFYWKTWGLLDIWFGQTNTTHDGIDALECSGLASGEWASVQAKSGGQGVLSFWWKTALTTPSDRLNFFIGPWQSAALTATTDWEQRTFVVPPGDVDLRWTFSNSSMGEPSKAWLDEVQFTPCNFRLPATNALIGYLGETRQITLAADANCPWQIVNTNSWITILSGITNLGSDVVRYLVTANPTSAGRSGYILIADEPFAISQQPGPAPSPAISLPEALDTEGTLTWETIGTPAWFGQTIVSRDGSDAAQSGPIGDSAAVTATTSVQGPGTVFFWWKVSSEANKDYLKFFINGEQQTRISGETDWQLLSYNLFSGYNVLKWTYSKNHRVAVGNDRGWLDQVQFVPTPATGLCALAISPISAAHSGNAETGSVSVVVTTGCGWDIVNTNSWITLLGGSAEGNGLVRYSVGANNFRNPRTGVLLIGGRPFTVTQASGLPPCSYHVSATNVSLSPQSWSSLVTVLTQPGCEWSVFNTNSWITIYSWTNSGSGHFLCSVSPNTVPVARTGQIWIEGHILTISQSAGPTPPAIPLAEALDTIGTPLVWNSGYYPWVGTTDVTHDGVDAAVSPAQGSGNSVFAYVTGPGTLTFWWKASGTSNRFHFYVTFVEQAFSSGEVDWEQRTISIPVGTHRLSWYFEQGSAGAADRGWLDQVQFVPLPLCPVTLSPGAASYLPGSSTGSISVAAAPDCAWNVFSSNSWISILSAPNGTGNGSVTYAVAANSTAAGRTGLVQIANQVFLVTQAGDLSTCTISILPTNRIHGYGSATSTVAVTTQTSCPWSVVNTNPWIRILSTSNSFSAGVVFYSVTPNTNLQTRSGNIVIGGRNFFLTQSGLPWLQIIGRTATNATFSMQGDVRKMYVIEYSADLIHWTPISTNPAPSTVTDAPAGNAPQRFYRTVEIP